MQTSILALLISSIVLFNQAPRTVEQVLGKDKTQSIIMSAISEYVASASDTYLLTDKSIEDMKAEGVEWLVLDRLSGKLIDGNLDVTNNEISLLGKEIEGKDKFLQAIKRAIGEEETRRYKDVILLHAQGYLILDVDFENRVIARVLNTEAPDKDVQKWLKRNFRKFLSSYVTYLKSVSVVRNRLTSHEERIDAFLVMQATKCGELECAGVPPCCGKLCDPCRN